MRHLIVIYLTFMMGLNVACSRVVDLGKDDLHSEPTIEIVRNIRIRMMEIVFGFGRIH